MRSAIPRTGNKFIGSPVARRQVTSFTPLDLPDLLQWLDPQQETGIAIGDPVPVLQDFSGNGNDVSQASGALQPIMRDDSGIRRVEFDGLAHFLEAVWTVESTARVYIVFTYDGSIGLNVMWTWGNGTSNQTPSFFTNSGNFLVSAIGALTDISDGAVDANVHAVEVVLDSGWIGFALDGLPIGQKYGFVGGVGNIFRIGQYVNGSFKYPGSLFQQIICGRGDQRNRDYLFSRFPSLVNNEPTLDNYAVICFDNAESTIGHPKLLVSPDRDTWTQKPLLFPIKTEHFNTGIPTAGDYDICKAGNLFVGAYTLTRDINTVLTTFGFSTAKKIFDWSTRANVDVSAIASLTRVWAPMANWTNGVLRFIFAGSTGDADGPWTIYETHATNSDWTTFSTPVALCGAAVGGGRNLIDPSNIINENGFFWFLAKDEDTDECVVYKCATIDGTYVEHRADLITVGYEGTTISLVGGVWTIDADSSGMSYFTQDSGDWMSAGASVWSGPHSYASTPFTMRHGTIIEL